MPNQVSNTDEFHREQERRSLDDFMVYNPTEEDYLVEWDKRYHRVPHKGKDLGFGKGRMELPRYLMEKYAREMKNKIINQMGDEFVEELVKEHESQGKKFRDAWEKNEAALARVPKTSDPKLIQDIYPTLVLGPRS